jgi:hypothetical protein
VKLQLITEVADYMVPYQKEGTGQLQLLVTAVNKSCTM